MTRPSDVSNMEARITDIGQEFEELRNEKEHIQRHVHSMEHDERMEKVNNRFSELVEEIAALTEQHPKIRETPAFLDLLSSPMFIETRLWEIWMEFKGLRGEMVNLRINSSGARQNEGYEQVKQSISNLSNEVEAILEKNPEMRDSRPFQSLVADIQQWRFTDGMMNSNAGSGIFGLGSTSRGRTPNDDRSDSLNPNSNRYNPGSRK